MEDELKKFRDSIKIGDKLFSIIERKELFGSKVVVYPQELKVTQIQRCSLGLVFNARKFVFREDDLFESVFPDFGSAYEAYKTKSGRVKFQEMQRYLQIPDKARPSWFRIIEIKHKSAYSNTIPFEVLYDSMHGEDENFYNGFHGFALYDHNFIETLELLKDKDAYSSEIARWQLRNFMYSKPNYEWLVYDKERNIYAKARSESHAIALAYEIIEWGINLRVLVGRPYKDGPYKFHPEFVVETHYDDGKIEIIEAEPDCSEDTTCGGILMTGTEYKSKWRLI